MLRMVVSLKLLGVLESIILTTRSYGLHFALTELNI